MPHLVRLSGVVSYAISGDQQPWAFGYRGRPRGILLFQKPLADVQERKLRHLDSSGTEAWRGALRI